MAGSRYPPAPAIDVLTTLSLLRLGSDTRAARLFHELWQAEPLTDTYSGWALVDCVADALRLTGAERVDCVSRARERADRALRDARALGLTPLASLDPRYPPYLATIPDPPVVLWVSGHVDALSCPSVAVVGSRRATPTGLGVAKRLSGELAEAGLTIVSGLARGIDGAAHRGALEVGGVTVAVLGNGLDVVYPSEHRELAAAVRRTGAVISEFPPGTRPHPSHFPLRNRIISGLSQAVVVVEASQKSGSLITARAALEQGRDVLAVPGSVASGCYRGCHALIKDGARLVETVDDILEEIGRPVRQEGVSVNTSKPSIGSGLERHLPVGEPMSVDDLALKTGRPAAEWLAEMTLLEMAGRVTRTSGGAFVRLDGPGTNIDGQGAGKRKGTGSVHGEGSGGRRVAGQGEDDK